LGLIVDSGIVVTENACKPKIYSGFSQEDAAVEGHVSALKEVEQCSSIISSTFPYAHTGIRWLPNG
jgi:multidrug efflux pump subunit AcrB